jgi:hypothetical protein
MFCIGYVGSMMRTFSMTWLEPIRVSRLGIFGCRLDVTILGSGPTAWSDGSFDDTKINSLFVRVSIQSLWDPLFSASLV